MPKKKANGSTHSNADPIDETYKELTGKKKGKYAKPQKGSAGKIVVTILVLILVCGLILFGLHFFSGGISMDILPSRTIAQGVTVAGVDVGGMTTDEAAAALSDISAKFATEPVTVTVLDREWTLTPAVSGAALDPQEAAREALRYGIESNAQLQVDITGLLNLNVEGITGSIAEFAEFFPTEGVESGYEILTAEDGTDVLKLTIGTEYYDFNQTQLYDAVLEALNAGTFCFEHPCRQLNLSSIDLEGIYAEHCTDPVEAILDLETYEVTQSSDGYRFDLEAATEALAAAAPGDTLEFPFQPIAPQVDTETLKSLLFRDELGSFTAYQASGSNRATNLRLACESLNGIILNPGETFSYNAALGERTAAKGYKPAASYLGGETVDTYGGGICQPSSCLYYACLLADIEIVQRSCHGFVSAYMPYGMDATVDWNGPDYKFRNSTDYPIRIEAVADGGSVTVKLIGTDTKDYYVKMEYEILGVTYPGVKEIEVEAGSGHRDGQVKTTAYTGYTVQTYKLKYDKETNELISREKEAYSNYSKRDKVVYRIKQEETKPTIGEADGDVELPTDTTTETPTTAPTTEPTTAATEPSTTAPTTAATEPSTTAPTTAATEPPTTASTEPSGGDGASTE